MKTVGIVIEKDGQSMTGKIEAFELKRTNDTDYSTYRMDAPTRRSFERMFGRNARLMASDIVCVTFGRRTLYRKIEEQNHADNLSASEKTGQMVFKTFTTST